MQVSDLMQTDVITANLRDGIYQTWQRMHERKIRHMPVLDDDGLLVGIISDRDIRRPSHLNHPNRVVPYAPDNIMKVAGAMTPAPRTVAPDAPLIDAIDALLDLKVGAMPVTEGQRLVGIISQVDLLRAYGDLLRA